MNSGDLVGYLFGILEKTEGSNDVPVPASHSRPEACKPFVPDKVATALGAVVAKLVAEPSLSKMVVILVAGLRSVGLLLLAHLLVDRDQPWRRREVEVRCPKCCASMVRTKNLREVQRYTLMGKLRYGRCRYQCPACGHRVFTEGLAPAPRPLNLSFSPGEKAHAPSS